MVAPTFKQRVGFALAVNIIGGLLVGYSIGYVPVAMTLHEYAGNCTRYENARAPCEKETNLCEWRPATATHREFCAFKHAPTVLEYPTGCLNVTMDACKNLKDFCTWDSTHSQCEHAPQWEAWQNGLYAGMMIVGGMIGSFAADWLLKKFGRKRVIGLAGFIGVMSVVFLSVGWQVDTDAHKLGSYGIMIVGRLLAGIAVGIASVACPMYCGEMAPPEAAGMVGCTFQVAVTFGIFLVALIGFLINAGSSPNELTHLRSKTQVVNALNALFPLLLLPVAMRIAEPSSEDMTVVNTAGDGSPNADGESGEDAGLLADYQIPLRNLKRNFVVALALAAAQQLTGINAVMNYAPEITSNFGLQPLTGNMLVMAWNFVTTIASIPIARKLSAGQMYVGSAVIASLACLMTAIPVFPSVYPTANSTSYALTGVGIFIFVAAFEMGMGPAFYVLAQSIFPASRRSFGCSFTVVVQFVFNLIINFCYPVAVVGLSGGANRDQRLGMACVFLFFGIVGLICTTLLGVNLHYSRKEQEAAEDAGYEYE